MATKRIDYDEIMDLVGQELQYAYRLDALRYQEKIRSLRLYNRLARLAVDRDIDGWDYPLFFLYEERNGKPAIHLNYAYQDTKNAIWFLEGA